MLMTIKQSKWTTKEVQRQETNKDMMTNRKPGLGKTMNSCGKN